MPSTETRGGGDTSSMGMLASPLKYHGAMWQWDHRVCIGRETIGWLLHLDLDGYRMTIKFLVPTCIVKLEMPGESKLVLMYS